MTPPTDPSTRFIELGIYTLLYFINISVEAMTAKMEEFQLESSPALRDYLLAQTTDDFAQIAAIYKDVLIAAGGKEISFENFKEIFDRAYTRRLPLSDVAPAMVTYVSGELKRQIPPGDAQAALFYIKMRNLSSQFFNFALAIAQVQKTSSDKITQKNLGQFFWEIVLKVLTTKPECTNFVVNHFTYVTNSLCVALTIHTSTHGGPFPEGFDLDTFRLSVLTSVTDRITKELGVEVIIATD